MLLTLKVLNDDATLNNFVDQGSVAQVVRGSDAKFILQITQVERKIRYIPSNTAVITMDLLNSDQTTVSLTASFPFADDRSIIEFDLSDADTSLLIGQNLIVDIQEGLITSVALLQKGLQMINPTQVGC